MRDATARRLGLAGVLLATWAIATTAPVPGRADSLSEPDAYAVRQLVLEQAAVIEQQGQEIDSLREDVETLYANDGILDDRTEQAGCLAYSDRHYVREQMNGKGRKWRLPLVVWRMDAPFCRPNPKKTWRPSRRANTPLNLEEPRVR